MTVTTASPPPQRSLLWRFAQILAGILVRVFYDLKVRGQKHIPKTGGVLIVSNHQSYLDPVLVAVMLERPVAYLAEAYLFKFKPFAMFIRSLNAFPIQQGKGDVGAMKESIRLLQSGQVLNVFPEGTRTDSGALQPIQGGVALLIRRAKVPVVPCIITGAYEAWPRHQVLPATGRVNITYGEPMRLDHLDGKVIVATLEATLHRMYAETDKD